jgi:hypothetical protein
MIGLRSRIRLSALILAAIPFSSIQAAVFEKYGCERGYFLDRWIGDNDKQDAHWSHNVELQSGGLVRAGGGYMDGHKIRLGDLAMWSDRTVPEKGVWIYQGIGNSVTQLRILIFNEHTKKVLIVDVGAMTSDAYQCELRDTQ